MFKSIPSILGFPYDLGCYWRRGSKEAPDAIRHELYKLRNFSLSSGNRLKWSLREIDQNNVELNQYCQDYAHEQIQRAIETVLGENKIPVSIGGDHSITLPIIRGLASVWGNGNFSIIHLDAHSDTFSPVDGYNFHHGAVFRNIIEEELVYPYELFQFGIRGQARDEGLTFVEKSGIKTILMKDFRNKGCNINNYNLAKDKNYYLSIDIDVVDPAFAPGTGTPVPGGLTSSEILDIVGQLAEYNLIGVDLVEVAPMYDISNLTSLLAANIIFEVLSYGY